MEDIVYSLAYTLKKYAIKNIHLILKIRPSIVVRTLIGELLLNGFSIFCVEDRLVCPHNGVRSRILPRK
jgi:ribosomal protein S11